MRLICFSLFQCFAVFTCPCLMFYYISILCPNWITCLMMQPMFVFTWNFLYLLCVSSWPSSGHQPGEEQAFPGCRFRLHGGGESAGPAGWLPRCQRQQSKYSRSPRSPGQGRAPPALTHGRTSTCSIGTNLNAKYIFHQAFFLSWIHSEVIKPN